MHRGGSFPVAPFHWWISKKALPTPFHYNRYDPATLLNELAELFNIVLVLAPNTPIDAKHTRIIKASITAYSTAVGPSSETKKRRSLDRSVFMAHPPSGEEVQMLRIVLLYEI